MRTSVASWWQSCVLNPAHLAPGTESSSWTESPLQRSPPLPPPAPKDLES